MEETARVIEVIWELLDAGRDERLADLLAEAHPADVARAIRELPVKDQVRVFRLLTPQHAGAVLGELDDPTLRELVRSLDAGLDERLAALLAEAHPADVARAIRELPVKDQVRVFRLLTPQNAGAVLGELDDPTLRELVHSLDEAEVSRALDRMPSD